jgi:AcrR family transcriptional regulator
MNPRRTNPGIRVPPRQSYRHGDLRRALIEAGTALAAAGGPEAVVLREATRRAGVVPNAAYRHFAGRAELLAAVRMAALSGLARRMEKELAGIDPDADAATAARASLRAVGRGYVAFALAETGLFRTIFAAPANWGDADPAKAGASGLNPFELLGLALDRMAAAGVLAAERRAGAEHLAWAAVHGLALLVIDGPLRAAPRARVEALAARVVEMVERGL